MADPFNDFINILKTDLGDLAESFGDDIRAILVDESNIFVEKTRDDLERWVQQLAEGDLSREEFEWLVKGKKDLAEMEALKKKGLAKAKVDKYKIVIINTVVGSAFKLVQ
jgi:hypothetical protein